MRERLATESAPLRPKVVADAIRAESGGVLGDTELLSNLRILQTELTGAGILEPLLCADGTTDVLVTAPDAVWVDDGNGLRRTDIQFADEAAVRRLAQRLALAAGRRLDDAQPWVDGQLTGLGAGGFAVRLHAVLPPVAVGGTCLSLRVLRPATQDLSALIAAGAIAPAAAELIDDIIAARLAFLVSGGTGAGKTTLLSAMLNAVAPDERIVCVEDAAELAPPHPHLVKLVARCANVEGVGEVTVRQLVRQALRMRPDRIVVGEVRGAEVVDLLAALNTGHDGGAGTVHANNPGEVPARLEALGALGGLDRVALHSQLAAAVQVLLHVARDRAGRRRLSEIAVLRETDGRVRAVTVWHADRGMTDEVGRFAPAAAEPDAVMTGPVAAALALSAAVLVLPSSPRRRLARGSRSRRPFPPQAAGWLTAGALTVGAVLLPLTTVFAIAIFAGTMSLRYRRRRRTDRGMAESRELETAIDVLVGELRVGAHPAAPSPWRQTKRPGRSPARVERWPRAPGWAPTWPRACAAWPERRRCRRNGIGWRCAGNWPPITAWRCPP